MAKEHVIKSVSFSSEYWREWSFQYKVESARFTETVRTLMRINYPLKGVPAKVRATIKTARDISDLSEKIAEMERKRDELQSYMDFLATKKGDEKSE